MRGAQVSHPFQEMDLPDAVREIARRLYPDLKNKAALQKVADEMGVALRTVYAWQSGEDGMNFAHARKMRALAKTANVSITPDSMLRRGGGSAERRKK